MYIKHVSLYFPSGNLKHNWKRSNNQVGPKQQRWLEMPYSQKKMILTHNTWMYGNNRAQHTEPQIDRPQSHSVQEQKRGKQPIAEKARVEGWNLGDRRRMEQHETRAFDRRFHIADTPECIGNLEAENCRMHRDDVNCNQALHKGHAIDKWVLISSLNLRSWAIDCNCSNKWAVILQQHITHAVTTGFSLPPLQIYDKVQQKTHGLVFFQM